MLRVPAPPVMLLPVPLIVHEYVAPTPASGTEAALLVELTHREETAVIVASGVGLTVRPARLEVAGEGLHVPLTTQSKPEAAVVASVSATPVMVSVAVVTPPYVEPLPLAPLLKLTPFFRH